MILTQSIIQFIEEHETDNIHQLALESKKYTDIDISLAIQQIEGRQIAKLKIPTWYQNKNILYPKHLSLEQCSSEYTALYKAKICLSGESFVDLTGGFGVDFSFLSRRFSRAIYVEQNQELSKFAKHNFSILKLKNAQVVNNDGIIYLSNIASKVDFIYIDPARRSDIGRKTVLIEDCSPNISTLQGLFKQKCRRLMIKLSPMLDISSAISALTNVVEIHIISYNNECKELIFIIDYEKTTIVDDITIHCVNITRQRTDIFTFKRADELGIHLSPYKQIEKYLYEPNLSIIKAGAYKSVANFYNLYKLHVNSHLYTSDNLLEEFQGRRFEVLKVSSLNKKEIKESLRDIKHANIATRNFPLSSKELKKRLRLNDGGDIYIFGTTLSDNSKVLLICRKL